MEGKREAKKHWNIAKKRPTVQKVNQNDTDATNGSFDQSLFESLLLLSLLIETVDASYSLAEWLND